MKALKKLSKTNINTIKKIESLFEKLKNNGVEWEGIDGGGGGTILFFKTKDGIDYTNLPKEYEGRDDAGKFQHMMMNESENIHRSNINIGIMVP